LVGSNGNLPKSSKEDPRYERVAKRHKRVATKKSGLEVLSATPLEPTLEPHAHIFPTDFGATRHKLVSFQLTLGPRVHVFPESVCWTTWQEKPWESAGVVRRKRKSLLSELAQSTGLLQRIAFPEELITASVANSGEQTKRTQFGYSSRFSPVFLEFLQIEK